MTKATAARPSAGPERRRKTGSARRHGGRSRDKLVSSFAASPRARPAEPALRMLYAREPRGTPTLGFATAAGRDARGGGVTTHRPFLDVKRRDDPGRAESSNDPSEAAVVEEHAMSLPLSQVIHRRLRTDIGVTRQPQGAPGIGSPPEGSGVDGRPSSDGAGMRRSAVLAPTSRRVPARVHASDLRRHMRWRQACTRPSEWWSRPEQRQDPVATSAAIFDSLGAAPPAWDAGRSRGRRKLTRRADHPDAARCRR